MQFPVHLELPDLPLVVTIYSHEINTQAGTIPVWTYVTIRARPGPIAIAAVAPRTRLSALLALCHKEFGTKRACEKSYGYQ